MNDEIAPSQIASSTLMTSTGHAVRGLQEIQSSTVTCQDDKALAAFGAKLMKSLQEDSGLARLSGTAALSSIALVNSGPLTSAMTGVISHCLNRLRSNRDDNEAECAQVGRFIKTAFAGLAEEPLFSSARKELLISGVDICSRVDGGPAEQAEAAGAFIGAVASYVTPDPAAVIAEISIQHFACTIDTGPLLPPFRSLILLYHLTGAPATQLPRSE